MRTINCIRDNCRCRRTLFRTAPDFRGTIEIKCPRCRRIHTYQFRGDDA